jgi:chemotaxis family two-component system response regulator Rcp1
LILLVEDNPADAGLVREALEEHQTEAELMVLSDGESAINFIEHLDASREACPDLIIVDMNLPKRSGREVLAAIRQSEECRDAQVVILNSSDAEQDRNDASRLGASLYIRKPTRLAEFLDLGAVFKSMLCGFAQ